MSQIAFGVVGSVADLARRGYRAVDADVWREFAFVSASAYSLALPRREAVVARPDDGHLPVVLVHGLGGNRGTFWPLRLYLRAHGRRRIYSFGFPKGTVEEIAAALVDFVDDVLRANGEKRVDIVCHSLGGLVARYALQRLGLKRKVGTLVTLATPHGGTHAARYVNTVLTRPLRPDSNLLKGLNGENLSRAPWRFFAVMSDRDIYVVPKEGMRHEAAETIFLPGLSHAEHLVSPRVFRTVLECLDADECRRGAFTDLR
ncbi:MAG: alpha/beta fold hydrolase [Deltaproteobacteria bacterium]|nr:alpha/beta fold hydrolase [Deltaproteobacteria bacterium]